MSKIAFLFPGQGAQYVGMSKKMCEAYKAAKSTFEEANEALGFDIQKLCFEGSMEELTKTENTQPAILTASVAAFRVFMQEIGKEPDFLTGHSLGEISALCCSGAIQLSDAVRIVNKRGKFMQDAVPVGIGSMAAVSGAAQSVIEEACASVSTEGKVVVVSNYNSPEQIVISGHKDAVSEAGAKLSAQGARIIPLKVSAPFHSPLMKPAGDRLKEELEKYSFNAMKWQVLSNVTALPYPGSESIVDYLEKQIVQPVRWKESMEFLKNNGVTLAIEMGPQNVLKNLMKKNIPDIKALSYDVETDLSEISKMLAVDSAEKAESTVDGIKLITKCIAITVCTRNRNWDEQEYQKGVVEPYRKLQSMKEELVKENAQPSHEQMKQALQLLKQIFETKKTPMDEQVERFNQIFDETGTGELFSDFKI